MRYDYLMHSLTKTCSDVFDDYHKFLSKLRNQAKTLNNKRCLCKIHTSFHYMPCNEDPHKNLQSLHEEGLLLLR